MRKNVRSNQFIQRFRLWQINTLLYEIVAGKTEWGVSRREGEKDRESRLRQSEMEHGRESKTSWVEN